MDVPKPTPELMASLPPDLVAVIPSLLVRVAERKERPHKNSGYSLRPPSNNPPSIQRTPPGPTPAMKSGGRHFQAMIDLPA